MMLLTQIHYDEQERPVLYSLNYLKVVLLSFESNEIGYNHYITQKQSNNCCLFLYLYIKERYQK